MSNDGSRRRNDCRNIQACAHLQYIAVRFRVFTGGGDARLTAALDEWHLPAVHRLLRGWPSFSWLANACCSLIANAFYSAPSRVLRRVSVFIC
jgi:hypothetical protein